MPLEIHEDKIIMRAGKYDLPKDKDWGFASINDPRVQAEQDEQRAQARAMLDSTGTTAVDRNYFWQPIATCPRGAKVQLLGRGGVAMYGNYNGKDTFYTHWAPLPKLPKDVK